MDLETFFTKHNISNFNNTCGQILDDMGISEDDIYDLACEQSYFLDEIFLEYHPTHIKSISKNLIIDEILWFDKKEDEEPSKISQSFEWEFSECEKIMSVISLFMQEKIQTFLGLISYLKKLSSDYPIKLSLSYGKDERIEFVFNKEYSHSKFNFTHLGDLETLFLYQILLLNKSEKLSDVIKNIG